MAPMNSWPSAPMLNRSALKPMATARPAKMYGVEVTRLSVSGQNAVNMALVSPVARYCRTAPTIAAGFPMAPRKRAV